VRLRSLLLVALLVVGVGCAESDVGFRTERERRPAPERSVATDLDPDDVVALALDDLEEYWERTMVEVYDVRFEPLRGGYVPFGPDSDLPRCGGEQLRYDQVAENALYCPVEDLIAWDREALIPDLQRRFGPLTVGLVMAHEFAHAVQNRALTEGTTVTLELQADCFAGAWVDDVDDRIELFASAGDALDQAVAGLLELRDSLGVPGHDPTAHGSGFDRVSAFQDGFEGGPEVCATYADDPPVVVAIPFGSLNDQLSGGNLPLADLLEPLVLDLESFFEALFAGAGRTWEPIAGIDLFDPADGPIRCGDVTVEGPELELAAFHCASSGTHHLDAVGLVPALEEIGDFAFGGELARLYAFAAQEQLDLRRGDPEAEGLHADCVTGAFSAAEFAGEVPDQQLRLSPGDLDEIIIAFLAFGAEGEASAFERTAAYRSGFLEGYRACADILG
jgi:predicted metalloprotease